MAELYFKVRADWEEATRLRRELDALEKEILNTSDATEEGKTKLEQLTQTYKKTYDTLKELVDVAAKNAHALQQMGVPIPDMILKQGALQKVSLSLGKSLIKLGLSAVEAKAALGAVATGGVSLALTGIGLVVKKLINDWKEKKQAIEEAKQAQEEFFEEVGKKAAPTIASFQELRDKWVDLKSEMAKTDFLKENKKALDKLGVSLNSVAEADQLFIDNADAYVRAQIRYAEADIYRAQVRDKIEQAAALRAKINSTEGNGKTVKVQRETTTAEYYRAMGKEDQIPDLINPDQIIKWKEEISETASLTEDLRKLEGEIGDAQEKVLDTLKQGDDELLKNQINGPFQSTTIQQDIDAAKVKWDTAKATLENINNNLDKYSSEQLKAARKAEDDARKEYEALAGKETKTSTKTPKETIDKEAQERERAYEKYKTEIQRTIKSMEHSIANEQISALETESERIRAKIELEKKENLNQLKEMGKAMSDMFQGNVDLLNRPEIDAKELYFKGWDDAGEGTATVFSSSYGVMGADGKLHEILVTPILPDGKVLSPEELEAYVGDVLDGADDILSADSKGIVIAVDVDEEAGERLHLMQEDYYYLKQLIDENDKQVRKNLYQSTYGGEVTEEEDDLDELLAQYGSYEDKKAQIHLKWLGRINAADEAHAEIYRRLYEQELAELEMTADGTLAKAFGKISDYTKRELEEVQRTLREKLAVVSDPETIKVLSDQLIKVDDLLRGGANSFSGMGKYLSDTGRLSALRKELSEAEKEGSKATEEEKRNLRDMINSLENLTKEEKAFALFEGVISLAGSATSYIKELADALGDSKLEDVASGLESVSFWGNTAMKIASGDYAGAAMGVITQVAGGIAQEVIMTEQLARNTEDFANALKLAALYVDQSDFASVFGNDRGSLMKAYGEKMVEAMTAYQEAMGNLNKDYSSEYFTYFTGSSSPTEMNRYASYLSAVGRGLKGLQTMQIKTKDRGSVIEWLGFGDEFTTLHDLAPQIFNEDGTLNIDNTKTFLGSDLSKYLDEAQRQALENAVQLQDAYEQNLQGLKDSISSVFGGLSDNLTDLIVDGIRNGTDLSTQYLKDNMLSVVDQLERQMINGMIFKYLSQYEDQMLNVAMNGNEQDMFDLYDQIFNGLDVVVAGAQQASTQFEAHARERGWDLTKLSDTYTQQATAGGFQTMSQDVASELNGRFTALQISNEGILQGMNFMEETMTGVIQNQLSHISISEDIRKIQADSYLALIQIRDNTEAIVSPIRDMRDDIEQIKKNTSNL